MPSERFAIPFHGETLTAQYDLPARDARASAVLLACGAGYHFDAPWMAEAARGLVERGFPVLRFNYLYRERALREGHDKPPDRKSVV